ncbi:MAG: hypothetical protein ACYSWU_21475 [Planctomycetota bacterium]|jgi:hypothetical protein
MNARQFAQQMKYELERVIWPVTSGAVVFGTNSRVRILAGEPSSQDDLPRSFPWCIIVIGSGTIDGDAVNFCDQTFQVFTAAHVMGDHLGEMAVIGGATADLTVSPNRGAGELIDRVHAAISTLTGMDGARILLSATSVGQPKSLGANAHLVMGELGVTALCTIQSSYAPPQMLAYAGGAFSWAGTQCSDRFDFLRYTLVRKAGTEPSTSPSDGTEVYQGTDAAVEVATVSSQTYTVFAEYDSRGNGTVEGYSDVPVGSFLTT